MNVCTICGSELKPLFVGTYCPKNCDRNSSPTSSWILIEMHGERWLYQPLEVGNKVPADATHGWYRDSSDGQLDEAILRTPWDITTRLDEPQRSGSKSIYRPMFVFKRPSKP